MKEYTIGDYRDAIEAFAPFSLQMSWDNSGLLVGSPHQKVSRALVALDATLPVIEEARRREAQLIVTHHPVIFHKLACIPAESPVYAAIQAGIGVLCAHTNLDIAAGGVNDALAEALGLEEVELLEETQSTPWRKVVTFVPHAAAERVYEAMAAAGGGAQGDYAGAAWCADGEGRFLPLEGANPAIGRVGELERVAERRLEMVVHPHRLSGVIEALVQAHPYEEPAYDVLETRFALHREGLGRIGTLKEEMNHEQLSLFVMKKLKAKGVKYVPGARKITRVAVCGGSGGDCLALAHFKGAQALVTGDVKHDQLLEAQRLGMTLIDGGHYATEAVVLPGLRKRLQDTLPGAEIVKADSCGDPACYLA